MLDASTVFFRFKPTFVEIGLFFYFFFVNSIAKRTSPAFLSLLPNAHHSARKVPRQPAPLNRVLNPSDKPVLD